LSCEITPQARKSVSIGMVGGESLLVIGAIIGHSAAGMTERYAHLSDDPVRAAADRISSAIATALSGVDSAPVRISRNGKCRRLPRPPTQIAGARGAEQFDELGPIVGSNGLNDLQDQAAGSETAGGSIREAAAREQAGASAQAHASFPSRDDFSLRSARIT
jgi:hypothetical protein